MNFRVLFAGALALASFLAGPALAQTVVTAAAPVVVATPATQEAVQNAAWWSGAASQVLAGLGTLASVVVAALFGLAWDYLRSKSKLARILFTNERRDNLTAGIQNQIRAAVVELQSELPGSVNPANLSPEQKLAVAELVQPRVEKAFDETLKKLGKVPGSHDVRTMILGHVQAALQPPPAVPPALPYPQKLAP